jgi:Putative transposase
MHHRELLGPLCAAAWQTVRELMAVAVGEEQGLRPGMVAMSQTFGDQLNPHPHVHVLVTRGGWTACGEWVGVPYLSIARIASPARARVRTGLDAAGKTPSRC